MERNVELNKGHKIHVSDWDGDGVWLSLQHRYARMHTAMTRKQAESLLEALNIALGRCPKCGGEEWASVTWSERQGVTPYEEYAECSCGHQWTMK